MKKLILGIAATFCAIATAQTPGTGAYNHATLDGRGFDQVNVGNLNVRFTIPIVSKAGRGLPFNYAIQYEGLVWSPVTNSGVTTWVPNTNWGFNGTLNGSGVLGVLAYSAYSVPCSDEPTEPGPGGFMPAPTYRVNTSGYAYHDPFGAVHSFSYSTTGSCPDGSGGMTTGDGSSSDGSGYKLVGGYMVKTANGITITPQISENNTGSYGVASEQDSNGNQITFNGTGAFTDTTGTTQLQITGSNPIQFTYPVTLQANGASTATATLSYSSYTVRSNFGCSGIVEYGTTTTALVDHITLADGVTTYRFTYEGTPGASDGAVTGRLASITLPTGGTISYTYFGGSNGVYCLDGTPSGLTRTTSNGPGPRPYWRAAITGNETTTSVGDNAGNQSIFYFSIDSLGQYEATHQLAYQGVIGQSTPLKEVVNCYNNNQSSNCDGQSITLPITSMNTTTSFNGLSPALTRLAFDPSGNNLTVEEQASGTSQQIRTVNDYATGARTELISTQTTDVSNNPVSATSYGYDQATPTPTSGIPQHSGPASFPGNQTSQQVYIDGNSQNTASSNVLTTTTAYYDTGQPTSSTVQGLFTTSYGYDGTQTFQTSTVLPTPSSNVGLSTSASYDSASGAALSTTGMNSGQTFTITQYDPLLRPMSVTTPNQGSLGQGLTTATYSPTEVDSSTKMNGSQSTFQKTYLDSYGRTTRVATQSSSGWYITDSCYETRGLLQWKSTPYLSSSPNPGSNNCSSSAATQYTYDALGRVTQISSPDGHSVSKTYQGRAVQVTDNNGQTRILQKDLVGRLIAVCEIATGTWDGGDATGACGSSSPSVGFDIGGNGFTTTYTYNLAQHAVTVNQGAQTRTFKTDAAGRTVSTTEPELGVTGYTPGTTTYAYAYNGTGLQVVRTRPSQNYTGTAGYVNHTTSQYDSLGRIVSISYDDQVHSSVPGFSGTPTKSFAYDQSSDVSIANMGASKGQLTEASNVNHGRSYQYDIMGRVTETIECFPGWCGQTQYNALRSYQYDLASNVNFEAFTTQPNLQGGYSVAYAYNTAGQLTSLIDGMNNAVGAPNIYTATASSMQPGGPQFITYGNNTTAWRQYDSLNRLQGQWVCGLPGGYNCPNSQYFYGFFNVQKGSKLNAETDTVNGDWSQYSYDPVGNLSIASNWNGNASNGFHAGYDRYGNRTYEQVSQTASGTGPTQYLSFSTTNNHLSGVTYDTAGNVVNDGQHTYAYDADNNLVMIDSNGSTATYWYDALGARVTSSSASGLLRYGPDLTGRRSTTWNASGNVVEAQYYASGQPVAFWSAADGNIHFEHQDWLGTERMRTDLAGNHATLASFSSLPFGEPNLTSGSDLSPAHFTGLDQDGIFNASSLGLHHAMFREYNSLVGRWMSPDPYSGSYHFGNPQTLNRYSYVMNQPLSAVDPLGASCVTVSTTDDNGDTILQTGDDGDGQGCAAGGISPGNPETSDQNPEQVNVNENDNSPLDTTQTYTFTISTDLSSFISELQGQGFYVSPDNNLPPFLTHKGTQLRSRDTTCGVHVVVDPNSGVNGAPVTGNFHYDSINPFPPLGPTLQPDVWRVVLHGAFDFIPDEFQQHVNGDLPSGNAFCNP